MSRSIFQNLPEAQQVLKLTTDELAGYLIEHFHSLSFGQRQQATVHNLANDISARYRARNDEVYRAISIACQWLINRGFLIPIGPQGILITTDEGRRATTATKMKSWMREIKGIRPVLTTGLPSQQSSQNSKTSTEAEKSRETDFDHANELYEKVRHLFNQTKSLDEGTAKLIVEAADDAIKEFGRTNQEKKVELKQLRAQAVSVLPPETLDELRRRAEGDYLRKLYPRNVVLQKLLLVTIGLFVIATILFGFYKTLFSGNGATKEAGVKPEVSTQFDTWITKAQMPTPRAYAMAGAIEGLLYVAGGVNSSGDLATLEVYDPTKNSWESKAPLPQLDTGHAGRYNGAAGVINGELYIAGGWRTDPPLPTNTLLIYNPNQNAWRIGPPMPTLSGGSIAAVIERKLYVLTAYDGRPGFRKLFHAYDPANKTWQALMAPPNVHVDATAGVINGMLYVAGGTDENGNPSGIVDVYDPVRNTWSTKKARMKEPQRAGIAGAIENKLYVAGGDSNNAFLPTLQVYDPLDDRWDNKQPLPKPRNGLTGIVIDNNLYVVGGATYGNKHLGNLEVYRVR